MRLCRRARLVGDARPWPLEPAAFLTQAGNYAIGGGRPRPTDL